MAKKKKNKNLGPRHKRMKREGRLQSAKAWIPTFTGKNIMRGYRARYGVDCLCAIRELEQLGIKFDADYVATIKRSVEGASRAKARNKAEAEENLKASLFECDNNFSYIAGYTEGGVPYGVPW